jgi:hypothetical protein
MSENLEVKVQIRGDICQDPELLETYSRRLREDILNLDVDSVDYVGQDDAPAGSKGVGASAVGDMILSLTPLNNVIMSVIGAVQSFVNRNHQCNITMEIGDNKLIISDMSPKEQQKLVDAWIKQISE